MLISLIGVTRTLMAPTVARLTKFEVGL